VQFSSFMLGVQLPLSWSSSVCPTLGNRLVKLVVDGGGLTIGGDWLLFCNFF
jgi:hypothetical protein